MATPFFEIIINFGATEKLRQIEELWLHDLIQR